MQTVESNARYIASTIASKMLDINAFDEGFIEDVPRDIISRITGKRFKKVYGNCPQKKLSAFKSSLSMVKVDKSLTASFDHNLQLLVEKLELPETCKQVLKLCAVATINEGLYAFFDEHLRHWVSDVDIVIAETLGLKVDELTCAVQLISNTSLFEQRDKSIFGLLLMPYALANNLMKQKAKSYHDLLDGLYYQIPTTSLTLNNYPHLELSYISEYLKHAVQNKTVGVNILLYGSAGTGKTSLSQVLSRYAKANLVAIKAAGENLYQYTDEINSEQNVAHLRLQHYRLMQKLFKPDKFSCLLIDEAEDVFSSYSNAFRISKDRLNATLERNTLPCVWISNHIDCLPQSAIRRFSYVLNVDVPPKHIKAEILAAPLKGLWLSQDYKNELANIPDLAPAHVVNASNVAKALHLTGKNAEYCIDHHIEECLSACGFDSTVENYHSDTDFNPDYININNDGKSSINTISTLIKTLKNHRGIRCLLTGVSGSGKSGLVHYLAEETGQELLVIQPADVLDMYVGGSEKKIQKLFSDAFREDKMILIDECDSLLRSRSEVSNQWERTVVNQLLLSLERSTQTTFLCSNFNEAHHGSLDSALMRRIDFKVQLDFLTAEQTINIYEENFGKCSTEIKNKLRKLKQVCPGDVAILSRRNKYSKTPLSDNENLEILIQENNRKIQNKAIGFVK